MKNQECSTHGNHQCCCGTQAHSHGDEHCHEQGSCQASCSREHPDFARKLLEIADKAWMEVLEEKIKENIKQTNGKHLDDLAKLVSESNHERWTHKMALEKGCKSFKEKLCEFFNRK